MVSDDTHGDVLLIVFTVNGACHIGDSFQYRLEYIRVIVGCLALQCTHQAFEAHTCIDNLGRKSFQAAVSLTVELHEHEVPDFDHLRMVFVYQLVAGHFGFLFFRT